MTNQSAPHLLHMQMGFFTPEFLRFVSRISPQLGVRGAAALDGAREPAVGFGFVALLLHSVVPVPVDDADALLLSEQHGEVVHAGNEALLGAPPVPFGRLCDPRLAAADALAVLEHERVVVLRLRVPVLGRQPHEVGRFRVRPPRVPAIRDNVVTGGTSSLKEQEPRKIIAPFNRDKWTSY